jgi:hypothetical protein
MMVIQGFLARYVPRRASHTAFADDLISMILLLVRDVIWMAQAMVHREGPEAAHGLIRIRWSPVQSIALKDVLGETLYDNGWSS